MKTQFSSLLIIAVVLAALSACSKAPVAVERISGATMGTTYSIIWPKQSQANLSPQTLKTEVDELLLKVNQQMSTYDPSSELSVFNKTSAPHSQEISHGFAYVMAEATLLHKQSSGYFDVTIGPLVNLWGFGPSNKGLNLNTQAPSEEEIKQAISKVGLDAVSVQQTTLSKQQDRYIDLSAIAKGYGVDNVAELMDAKGIENYLVEIGGEMRAKGEKAEGTPWKVAIESPDLLQRKVHKILALKDYSIATSGDYRNYFEVDGQRYSHSINPFNGLPVQHKLASVTVIHQNCSRADGLATAMLIMGEQKAKEFAQLHKIKAYFIERQGTEFKEYVSPEFQLWLDSH